MKDGRNETPEEAYNGCRDEVGYLQCNVNDARNDDVGAEVSTIGAMTKVEVIQGKKKLKGNEDQSERVVTVDRVVNKIGWNMWRIISSNCVDVG